MSNLEFHLQRLSEWVRTLDGCPDSWADIFIVEDPSFYFRGETWKVPKESLKNAKQYEKRFNYLLRKGYSWININFGGIYQGDAIVFVEYPRKASGIPENKVSVNFSGPEGYEWDLTEKLSITE